MRERTCSIISPWEPDRYARLMRTLQFGSDDPERCYALASMVRCTSVVLNPHTPQGEPSLNSTHIFNLFDNLPILEFVELTEPPPGGLGRSLVSAEEDIDFLATLKRLRSVILAGHVGPVGESILIGLPCLRELHLSGDIPASWFSYASPNSGCSIRRLTWGTTLPPTLQRVRWIFAESEASTGGEIILLVRPSELELDAIRQYALQRGMNVQVADPIVG